ncbi:hypothetical protein SDC9_74778 [bioreactor metagenome]|uniref:Cellulose synthase regulatory subunit n=1 Tax=bioreactor metagenome TaxID=1076179 RepID=A0A644YJR6_9ZZZZ
MSNYPSPFLDNYLASKINTVVYLPESPDHVTLAALLDMASNWGMRELSGVPQRMEVRFGEPGQVPANEVVLGQTSNWFPNQNLPNDAPVITLRELPGGYSRLLITGETTNSLAKAIDALNRPQLTKTFFGQQMVLSAPLNSKAAKATNIVTGKSGRYTLVDLGYAEDIAVSGAFHQEAVLNIPRPSNYKIGDGSYIETHFRHSRILDPKKSALTVYINDIPIRATALIAENAEQGILKVPIPGSEQNKPMWRVRFGFYHDLGIVDCSKRYDEVAWSVIEKETTVFLKPGKVEQFPEWGDFPNSFSDSSNGNINLTMLLPEQPSQEELSAAFKLAYFIGQNNKRKIKWHVQTASNFDERTAVGTVIAIGRNDDTNQWTALQKYLSVFPESNSGFHIASWVEVMPESLRDFDIYQIGKIDNDRLLYAFMYTNPARINELLNLALLSGSPLTGQVALVDAQGNHASFSQQLIEAENNGFVAWLNTIVEGIGAVGAIYLTVTIAIIAATLVLMFFMRKHP